MKNPQPEKLSKDEIHALPAHAFLRVEFPRMPQDEDDDFEFLTVPDLDRLYGRDYELITKIFRIA